MKQTLYTYQAWGKYKIDVEITADVKRELTENDYRNASKIGEKIVNSLMEETYNIDPQNKIVAEKERTEILSVFGDRSIFVEEIPNGYCDRYCCKHLPWFIVTTTKGRIKIGWRKRVIHIDWEDSIIPDSAETLFPDQDVTKFDKGIHAWGIENAKVYIDKLLT
jgi:hypothetical protein